MPIHPDLRGMIDTMLRRNASDLILTEGQPPVLRVMGDLVPLEGQALTSDTIKPLAYGLLTKEQQQKFEETGELDSSFGLEGVARFRVNVFFQRGAVGTVIRMLPHLIPTMESLGVPPQLQKWLMLPHGIIILTGPTGSGKSTSQAAMIGFLNQRKPYHVITIEDPVEYVHQHGTCTIEQREIGRDTQSFPQALKHVFRQSPDVIMIGEMRDRETFESALQLAETGHLVLATLHTGDAAQAVSRIVDMFPSDEHTQVRIQLSLSLIGILVQQLVPKMNGQGRILAVEVLEAIPAVRNMIRKNDLQQIYSVIQTSSDDGMVTMNDSLLRLFLEGTVSLEQASLFTNRHKELDQMVGRLSQQNRTAKPRETAQV